MEQTFFAMGNQNRASGYDFDANSFVYGSYACVVLVLVLLSIMIPPVDAVIWINSWNTPALDILFPTITELGNGLIMIPFAVLLLFRWVSN